MNNNKKIICFLTMCLLLTSGCYNEETYKESKKSSDINLKKITFVEPPEKFKNNVLESIKYRIEWTFSNGSTSSPKEKDIVWQTVFNDHAIAALKIPIPDKNQVLYHLVFLQNKKIRWAITTGIECSFEANDPMAAKFKIKLPMKKFSPIFNDSEIDKKETWTFVDNEKVITIAKYKLETDIDNKSFKKITLGNRTAYIKKDNKSSLLYYIEKNNVIWISGNITEGEITALAESLPQSDTFLYKIPSPSMIN